MQLTGTAMQQISQRCKQVQPKLQKWIQEAEERNPEQMGAQRLLSHLTRVYAYYPYKDKLLTINDLINQVLERYASFKRGDRNAVAEIDPAYVMLPFSRISTSVLIRIYFSAFSRA